MSYDAFISYSHATDGQLAPALQRGLQRLAKPWNRRRALNIFRDETGLSTNPHLWSSVQAALDESEWFILLASPEAAASEWVNKEIEHWLATKTADHILSVVTDGTWSWDANAREFSADSAAVPLALRGAFTDEPRHLDLRWARDEEHVDLRHTRFRDAVADLAAPLHGVAKDELEGEDIRQHRHTRRLARGAIVSLVLLLVAALVGGGLAVLNGREADRATARAEREAVSAQVDRIVAEVPALLRSDRGLAALLAVEGERLRPNPATRGALLTTLTDEPRLRFTLHGGRTGYLFLAPFAEGDRVAAMGRDGVDIWDLEARELVGSFDVGQPSGVAVAPDGDLIATGSTDGTVAFWDTGMLKPSGEPVEFGAPVGDLVFSPDGRTLAVALGVVGGEDAPAANVSRLVDVATHQATRALDGHTGTVNAVAFSPDGRYVATGGNDANVVFHDATTGATVGDSLALDHGVLSVSFSPDGRLLATGTFTGGSGESVAVFDVATRTRIATNLPGAEGRTTVRFTPDGSRLVVSGAAGDVQLWSTSEFKAVGPPIETQHGPTLIASLPTAGLVLAGYDGTISAWEPNSSAPIARDVAESAPAGGVFSPDGSLLATVGNDDTVVLYRTKGLRKLGVLSVSGPGSRPNLAGATPVAFSTDGNVFAVGDRQGSVQLYDVDTRTELGGAIRVGMQPVSALRFSPDGRILVATSTVDGANGAHVIDIASRAVHALEPPVPFAFLAAFSPDGTRLVVPSPAGAFMFSVSGGAPGRGTPFEVHETEAVSPAFSPDGALVAVGTLQGTLVLLDAKTLRPLGEPIAVSESLAPTVEFSPDGKFVVMQDVDGFFHLVDVRARAPMGKAFAGSSSGYGWASFAPDSRTLVLPGVDGSILLDLEVSHWRNTACERAGRSLTPEERERYLSSADGHKPKCRDTQGRH